MNFSDIKEAIAEFSEAHKTFSDDMRKDFKELKSDTAALRDRVELIETKNDAPKLARNDGVEFKVFHCDEGEVYELPAHVKMADVIRPDKKPEIAFERWLPAALLGDKCQDREAVQFAREQKQMVTTTTGVLIPAEYQSTWIDMLRANMVLNQAGLKTVTMEQKTQVHAAVTVDPIASWHAEAGSISVNNPTFAERKLTSQTLVTRCQGSVELAQDSPDFGAQLAGVMARSMAAAVDRAGLVGSGSPPEPQGILGTSGVNQVTAIGALADYSDMISGVQKLLESNVPLDVATAFAIMPPIVWSKLENLATGISSDKTQLPRPRSLQNTRFLVTSSIPSENSPLTTTAFMGDFRDLLLGVRRDASVEALKLSTYATNLLIEFVAYTRVDFLVARPASFVTLEDITAK